MCLWTLCLFVILNYHSSMSMLQVSHVTDRFSSLYAFHMSRSQYLSLSVHPMNGSSLYLQKLFARALFKILKENLLMVNCEEVFLIGSGSPRLLHQRIPQLLSTSYLTRRWLMPRVYYKSLIQIRKAGNIEIPNRWTIGGCLLNSPN